MTHTLTTKLTSSDGKPDNVIDGKPDNVIDGKPDNVIDGQPDNVTDGQPDNVIDGQRVSIEGGTDETRNVNNNPSYDHEPPVKYTLPFKFLGSAHNLNYQKHLEAAYNLWNSGETSLDVLLFPEKNKKFDPKAIAVSLKYNCTGFHRVGFIAKELTRHIHPYLNTDNLFAMAKRISFRVDFLMVGYYLTIEIKKQGEWSPDAVRASKRVR